MDASGSSGSSPRMSASLSNFVRLRPMPSGDSYMEEYEKQLKAAGSPKFCEHLLI